MVNPEELLFETKVPEGAVAVFWYGQNSFAVKDSSGTVVLIDPYFPAERPAEKFIHAHPPVDERRVRADAVLLTHDHGDHTCIESISRLMEANPDLGIIGPPESIERVEAEADGAGGAKLWPVVAGGAAHAGAMNVHAVYSKVPAGEESCMHLGYVIETRGGRVYVSGDPQNDFADTPSLVSPVKNLAPLIGLLTTHPTEGEFPFFDGSAKTAASIGLQVAIPSHYGCFVKRTYNPIDWAESFPRDVPARIIIPYAGGMMFSVARRWYVSL